MSTDPKLSPELALLELVTTALAAAAKGAAMIQKARSEGRTVSQEEFDALEAQTTAKRKIWDEGNESSS